MTTTAAGATRAEAIAWGDDALALELRVGEDGGVTVERLYAPAAGLDEREGAPGVPVAQVSCAGEGRVAESPSAQQLSKGVTSRLRYAGHEIAPAGSGERLTILQRDPDTALAVTSVFERVDGGACLRAWTEVANEGSEPVTLDLVSSLCATNLVRGRGEFAARARIRYARNAWGTEMRWATLSAEEAGLVDMGTAAAERWGRTTRGRFAVHNTGSWSTGGFLPMGSLEDAATGQCWLWQVESNAGWLWELGDHWGHVYLLASGPTDQEHQWRHRLEPGATFAGVPVAVAVSAGGFEAAVAELTRHRRAVRRPHEDNRALPVVFNDYMNCLMGDPSTERLLPLIDAAAAAGAEYFVVDAGWYSDDPVWWDGVGAWEPSAARFPNGLGEVMDRIRARGMRPGLWLEPEMVGVRSPVATELPDGAFFVRHGRRVTENGRHQLDLRHPAARAHLDATVDRLVRDFGIEYFKLDYNVNIGAGTDAGAAGPGDGLLAHARAYLAWLESVLDRHRSLVLENCAAGGMRMDYAQLSRLSIQSTSDQQEPVLYAPIAAAAPAAVTPEQSAVWAYPQPEYDDELNAFTMVNALLQRVHLSGRIDRMDSRQLGRVRSAVDVYRAIRTDLAGAVPHWPLGLPRWTDAWTACCLENDGTALLAVWRRGGGLDRTSLDLGWWAGGQPQIDLLYPTDLPCDWEWDPVARHLAVHLPSTPSARLLRLRPGDPGQATPTTGSTSYA